jgi:excisionase family DNA binding protein
MNEFLSIKDVMKTLKVCRATVLKHMTSGRLLSYRVGRLIRIKDVDLQRFIEGQPVLPQK